MVPLGANHFSVSDDEDSPPTYFFFVLLTKALDKA